jgi:hydroxycarboxylate dehydrogenase B
MADTSFLHVRHDRLRAAVRAIFAAAGSSPRECALVAEHLVEANLRGHDSHGVGMIPDYIQNAGLGELTINGAVEVVRDGGGFLVCEGGLGLGQVIAHDAVALAIGRAKETGACILALRNSHHIGRIGHWAEQCAAQGLVSLHFVNVVADPLVAPFGGTAGRLVTNPVAIGFPRPGHDPIIVDFATSKLAAGKVRVAMNKGEELPDGVLIDGAGRPTRDPSALFGEPRGALLPFGDHKGWGLALACELLGGALSGGPVMSGPRRRRAIINSMFSVVVDPEAMGTAQAFLASIEQFLAWAREPRPGEDPTVLVAGEPERARRAERIAGGVPVDPATWEQIAASAETAGLPRQEFERIALHDEPSEAGPSADEEPVHGA